MERELRNLIHFALLDLVTNSDLDFALEYYLARTRKQQRLRSIKGIFNLETMDEEDILLNFRFFKTDLPLLQKALEIPENVVVGRGYTIRGINALCILLRRLAYPSRLKDMESMFGMSGPFLSTTITWLTNWIYSKKGHLLSDLGHLKWLNKNKIKQYCKAVSDKGAPLKNCWGFIASTARRICRPTVNQENYYSEHKKMHCVKYQSVLAPDGLIVSLHGAYEGSLDDADIFRESSLCDQLKAASLNNQFIIYADPDYPISDVLISPFQGERLTDSQQTFNNSMSKVRQPVEWGFMKVARNFSFVDFHKNQKLLLQQISDMYHVAVILTNCHTCLYGSQTGGYFGVSPPKLEEYLDSNTNIL